MNKYLPIIILLFFVKVDLATAQNTNDDNKTSLNNNTSVSYEQGKTYILGGITVTGLQKFSESTVRIYTGLKNGQPIKLPGDKLTSAIKKLYESKQFSKVDVYLSKIDGDTVYLQFDVAELPQLNNILISGVRRSKSDEIKKETELKKGKMVTDNLIVTTRNYIKKKFTDKGFLKTKVILYTKKDTSETNSVDMKIYVDKGSRIKIKDIVFKGNKGVSDGKLRGAMSNTKRKFFGRFWKASKYIEEKYKEDLESIIEMYSELGYRDARIISDELVWNDDNTITLNIEVKEGKQYRFGDIRFVGNKEYTDEQLSEFLRIEKGDIYNGKVLKERVSGDGTANSQDIATFYQNRGFLFSQINAVETNVKNDSITVEVRIREDEKARINKVTVTGNDTTNDHVIYRELRIKPGDLYSKNNIIRSIREIGQLGFFSPNVEPNIEPDHQNKTTDVSFKVEEKGGSQIELQGGYGGGSLIGTLGLSFSNFSLRNIFNKKAYKPLPMGDGQKLSLRFQVSRTYETYSFSFSEPWLGGKTPQSLSASLYYSNQYRFDFSTGKVDRDQSLGILGASIGLGRRLTWPDDSFSMSQNIAYQRIRLKNYPYRVGSSNDVLKDGDLNNLSYSLAISRNSSGPGPIFPTYGSEFTFRAKATFPYSLVNNKDYSEPDNLTPTTRRKWLADKYRWLEYYKFSFTGKWYTELAKNFVLYNNAQIGYLGTYNSKLGLTPVERFFVGGDGMAQGQLDGREVIGLRGYENSRLSSVDGGAIYTKYQLELRYSITQNPTASIYTIGFLEAGNSYNNFTNFNPFNVKRSAGFGVRIFMQAFGLLGIDFAYGFDPLPGQTTRSGWQPHFIIGQQF